MCGMNHLLNNRRCFRARYPERDDRGVGRRVGQWCWLAALLYVPVVMGASPCLAAAPFEVVVFGDTQSYVLNDTWNQNFIAQSQWVVDNEQQRNIKFVTQAGDLVEHPSDPTEWQRADTAMSILDQTDVVWSTAFGNHEWVAATQDATLYMNTFGPDRFAGESWFGGGSPSGQSSYQRFSGGGKEFLHVALAYDAPTDDLAWAQSVVDMPANQGLPTMVTTHVSLNDNRGIFNSGSRTIVRRQNAPYTGGTGRRSAEAIWDQFIRTNPQIFMVFNGHMQGERLLVSDNIIGEKVWQMQVDYSRRPNGGNGWTKLLTFDLDNDQIQVQTYSPTLDQYALVEPDQYLGLDNVGLPVDHYTGGDDTTGDGDAEFLITLDFDGVRFGDPVIFGDLNFDGAINEGDWTIFRGYHLTDLSGLTPAEAYARGDLDADLDNDEMDFTDFKEVYNDANGAGAFNAMLANVPEPSTLLLVAAASATFLFWRLSWARAHWASRRSFGLATVCDASHPYFDRMMDAENRKK